jgi:hypothetical protein
MSYADQFIKMSTDDLDNARCSDEYQFLFDATSTTLNQLPSNNSDDWIKAAAAQRLLSKAQSKVGHKELSKSTLESANDCELHALRLTTNNNKQALDHLRKYLKNRGGFTT